jgi:hypothetical protein
MGDNSQSINFGAAQGDPCKQIIKNATGVLAVNGVNYISNTVMQNATAQFGNAANTSLNLNEATKQLYAPAAELYKGGNLNINPNTNQNANIITIAPGQ